MRYELNSATGEHCRSYTDSPLGSVGSACLSTSWLKHYWATCLSGVTSHSGQMWLEDTLQWMVPWFSFLFGQGRLGPHLRRWIRLICTHLCSLVKVCPPVWFCRWAEPLVGITAWSLQVWIQSARICVLQHRPPPPTTPAKCSLTTVVVELCRSPCSARGVRLE